MENLIGDILSTVRLKSAVYFKHGFCSPWGMDAPAGEFSQFHLVTHGNCLLSVDGKSIELEKGDIAIFPKGLAHQIKDREDAVCRAGREVVAEIQEGKTPFAGQVAKTHLICGHYEMDRELSHPIFENLPGFLIIKSSEYGRFDLIHSIFELIVEELENKQPGHQTISLRFAEILFISIIRHYYLNQAKDAVNLFKDEAIYQSVDLIHKQLASTLNIENLARQAGLSRTLFINRFKSAVGETPLKYITNWRMTKAKYLLNSTDMTLTEIGEKIGYPTESSFNRAFKQNCQVSPGRFRTMQR